jgi:hypothetical protein
MQQDIYPNTYIRFICHFNNKVMHEEVKQKVYLGGGMILREKVRDLRDGYVSELEVGIHGATLYKEIVNRQFAVKTFLLSDI